MPKSTTKICLYGAGVMGCSVGRALIASKFASKSDVWGVTLTHGSAQKVKNELGIQCCLESDKLQKRLADTGIVILSVKPAQAIAAAEKLKRAGLRKDALIISIVTGVTAEKLERALGTKAAVVRACANTPCVVGQGMTAVAKGSHATPAHMKTAREIFERVGRVVELNESLCDAVTALGGCGPAYIFLMIEALADGGVRVGLPRDVALEIVTQTMRGAATLVQESGRHPASLRDDVTTPAGCTIGALLIMEDGKMRSVLARAVEEATAIAKQLGQK